MVKKDFTEKLSAKYSITKKEAEKAIDMVLDTITEALKNGEEVNLTGFGKFRVSERSERKSTSPVNHETIIVPAHKAPVFSAGAVLKKEVNS